jgi:hypothetical protein
MAQTAKKSEKHTLIPTGYEVAGFTTASIALLLVITVVPIIRNVNSPTYEFMSSSIGTWLTDTIQRLNTPRITSILTFVLWALAGALFYILFWSILSLLKSYREDVDPFHGLIVPKDYRANIGLHTRIARIVVRSIAMVAFVVWIWVFFAKLLPFSVNQFVSALTTIDQLSIAGGVLAVLYVAAGLYVFAVSWRLILLRRRVFGS